MRVAAHSVGGAAAVAAVAVAAVAVVAVAEQQPYRHQHCLLEAKTSPRWPALPHHRSCDRVQARLGERLYRNLA